MEPGQAFGPGHARRSPGTSSARLTYWARRATEDAAPKAKPAAVPPPPALTRTAAATAAAAPPTVAGSPGRPGVPSARLPRVMRPSPAMKTP
jgi:hypothetical protein